MKTIRLLPLFVFTIAALHGEEPEKIKQPGAGAITFTGLKGWPGNWIAAEGTFMEGDTQRRAGVFIGPEFATVSRPIRLSPRRSRSAP